MKIATKSTGRAGEEMAQYWFKARGWKMHKVAPPSRVIGRGSSLKVIYTGKGYPDFMGHEMIDEEGEYPNKHSRFLQPNFRACEVKEAKPCEGDSVPASRLTATQRAFMADLPEGAAYVGILWRSGDFEMFRFIAKGSYKKGKGMR